MQSQWALGSTTTNKLVEVMEFQLGYLRSWKMLLLKCRAQCAAHLENSAVATGLGKVFSFQFQRKAMPNNAQTTAQLHTSHTLAKWSEVAQWCPTLHDPIDHSLPGFSVHGIFQARVLEWVAISFSRGSSRPRDQTQVSYIADRRFTLWATREVIYCYKCPSRNCFCCISLVLVWCVSKDSIKKTY